MIGIRSFWLLISSVVFLVFSFSSLLIVLDVFLVVLVLRWWFNIMNVMISVEVLKNRGLLVNN